MSRPRITRRAFVAAVGGAAAAAAARRPAGAADAAAVPSYLKGHADLFAKDPKAAALAWFREARFGLFMHYGLYSLLGRGEWVMYQEQIPVAEYEKLDGQFRADKFDADFITDLARDAGMSYVNITARHHDSFCLFRTNQTDFNSVESPAKRDLVGELAPVTSGAMELATRELADLQDDVTAAAFVADPANAEVIVGVIERQRPHFDSVALQLGYSYDPQEPVIADATDFQPRAIPGRRLPHGWLDVNGTSTPAIDLVDDRAFTVLLLDATAPPRINPRYPVTVTRLSRDAPDVADWLKAVDLNDVTALLIRPDGHILDLAHGPHETARFEAAIAALLDGPAPGHSPSPAPPPDGFRRYVYPSNHPRLAGLDHYDAAGYTDAMCHAPLLGDALKWWKHQFESTTFSGITNDGVRRGGLYPLGQAESAPTGAAVTAANALIRAVSAADGRQLVHPVNSKVWRAWMNPEFYLNRFGLRLEEHDQPVRALAHDLIRASVSEAGYELIRNVMATNGFLGELVRLPRLLNENSYNINIFGTPSIDRPWGWNLYGHHLCLNCLFIGDQQVFTPIFLGAEPNEIDTGAHAGTALFTEHQQRGLDLVRTLPADLAAQAILYHAKRDPAMPPGRVHPADELHLAGMFQDNRQIADEGLNLAGCPGHIRDAAVSLVEIFLRYQPEGPRRARLAAVREHLDETWFCWIGGTDDEAPFYYRIQSPVILIEFDHHAGVFLSNSEPERFHIHTVVRTPNGNDYGAELVSQYTGSPVLLDGPR